jgi:hypothetical protein
MILGIDQSQLSSGGDNITCFFEKKIDFWRQKAVLIALFGATLWLIRSHQSDPPICENQILC